jgi:nucleotide-binding universal stress UspA family protein
MSARLGTELLLLHLDAAPDLYGSDASARSAELSEQLLSRAAEVALAGGARPAASIARRADSVAGELGRVVIEFEADVIVIGSTPRSTGDRVHLGPVAAHLLETCPATVVVVATPSGWSGHAAHG